MPKISYNRYYARFILVQYQSTTLLFTFYTFSLYPLFIPINKAVAVCLWPIALAIYTVTIYCIKVFPYTPPSGEIRIAVRDQVTPSNSRRKEKGSLLRLGLIYFDHVMI